MRINRKWAAVGLLAVAQVMGKCKRNVLEIAQIYGATAYLKGVSIARDFFLYQIGILAAVMLLVFGVVLMEVAVIFFIPAVSQARGIWAFTFGVIDLLIGVISLGYFSSSKRWLRQSSKYNVWLKSALNREEEDSLSR